MNSSGFGSTPVQRTRRSLLSKTSTTHSPSAPSPLANSSSSHSTPSRRSLAGPGLGTPVAAVSIGSATKPFDFAGSERAARRAVETPTKARVVVPGGGSKRFIRKKPILQRVADLPASLLDRFDLSFDADPLARPVGLALTILHFLLRAPLWSASQTKRTSVLRSASAPKSRWEGRWDDPTTSAPSSWRFSWTTAVSLLLCALAASNAMYLFTRTRSYKMHLRTDPLNSPNARKVEEEDPFASTDAKASWMDAVRWARKNLSPVPVARFLLSLPPTSASTRHRRRLVPQLDVWAPPVFNLHLFSTYTPPSALVLHFLTPSAPFTAVVIALIVSFQSHMLVGKYGDLIKDKEILQGEVMHEYDAKFVYPTLFKHRKDASTSTCEAETLSLW